MLTGHATGAFRAKLGAVGLWLAVAVAGWCLSGGKPAAAAERLLWHSDYSQARQEAIDGGKLLCLAFEDRQGSSPSDRMWSELAAHAKFEEFSSRHVFTRLSSDTKVRVNGQEISLLQHGAFREMHGKPGLAILDFSDPESPQFGHVVSVYPRYPVPQDHLQHLLSLPSGSLTQRTLILAVRMHPERPQSTAGDHHPLLASEAESHSLHQANITNQGHHNFDTRFHRINARLTGGLMVQEVVAESWPGQGLFDAAVECVGSWRQSGGHWSAVRSRHRLFGYDMKRGRNGVWYATGLFARP